MNYWIVSSRDKRDPVTEKWDEKWTVESFLRSKKFFPWHHKNKFEKNDRCILKVSGSMNFVGDFKIISDQKKDKKGDIFYEIDTNEWVFPVHQRTLPMRYTRLLTGRALSIRIGEEEYYGFLGIRDFTQNLRINYKNILKVRVSEEDLEDLLDAKNPLRSIGLEIVAWQLAVTPGNKIDLLCKDAKGDYVVVELKKHSANETIGQLARYVTDVKENIANAGQKVKGLILTLDVDEQLIKAARGVDFDVVLYQLTLG
jgi:hypothetical protein